MPVQTGSAVWSFVIDFTDGQLWLHSRIAPNPTDRTAVLIQVDDTVPQLTPPLKDEVKEELEGEGGEKMKRGPVPTMTEEEREQPWTSHAAW